MKTCKCLFTILFLLAICLQGCGGRVKDGQVDFKEVRQGHLEICSEPFFYDTYKDLWVLDEVFVVVGYARHSEKFVHVFNRATGAYEKSFLEKGRSADEVLSVGETWLSGQILYLWDYVGRTLYSCDLSDIAHTDGIHLDRVEMNDNSYTHVLCNGKSTVQLTNASFIENPPMNAKPRILKGDIGSKNALALNGYPMADRFKTWWMYMQPTMAIDPDFHKLALLSSCYYGCVMELFSMSADKIECVSTLTLVPPAFEGAANAATPDADLRYGAVDAIGTDEFVILAFDGNTSVSDKEAEPSFNNLLWFDWTGKPVRKLVIDKSVVCLCAENGTLYALVDTYEGDARIVRVDL